jgi:FKBP-type peptidyl-prolyl cis-trans isomerase SlyD
MTIDHGKKVSLEYTVKLDDGTQVDSNVGGEPLTFTAGSRQIIPGLEERLMGLEKGETRHLVIPAAEAYGPVKPEAFQEVERRAIPEDAREVGATLVAEDRVGNRQPVRVHEVKQQTVVLDLNHPLAGQDLAFDVKILDVD